MINIQRIKYLLMITTVAVLFLVGGGELTARARIFSIIEKTRGVSIIIVGDVIEADTDYVIVKVGNNLKGVLSASRVKVTYRQQESSEMRIDKYLPGDKVIVFTNEKDNKYIAFSGSQGIMKIQGEWTYSEDVISKVLKFDTAQNPDEKSSVLVEMLSTDSNFAQLTALEIIYIEYNKGTFKNDILVQPVVKLAEGKESQVAVNAIQVLGRIGDNSTVPHLIQMLGSSDNEVAESAYNVLKNMVRGDIGFDSRQSIEEKKKSIIAWQEWWEKNKEKVILVK